MPKHFEFPEKDRVSGWWIPVYIVVFAVAIALSIYANIYWVKFCVNF